MGGGFMARLAMSRRSRLWLLAAAGLLLGQAVAAPGN